MTNLIIPVGIPGSGKSTWARTILDRKYAVISSDEYRKKLFGSMREAHKPETKVERNEEVWKLFYQDIENCLNHSVDVFADATNLRAFAREKLVDIAKRSGARTHVLIFSNSKQAWERNELREEDRIVPTEVMADFTLRLDEAIKDIPNESYNSVTTIASVQ